MNHLIRDVDPEVWRRVKARASLEGITMKEAINRLLEEYARGLGSHAPASARPSASDSPVTMKGSAAL